MIQNPAIFPSASTRSTHSSTHSRTQSPTQSPTKSLLCRLARTFALWLALLAFPSPSLEAQEQPSAAAGSLMLQLDGPSKVLLGKRLGCSIPPEGTGDPLDPDGGGPVASTLDINDMMVIPPRRLFLDHDLVVFVNGYAGTNLRVRGLCTQAIPTFQNSCGKAYAVTARALPQDLDGGGSLELFALGATGGRFLVDLPITLELTLTNLADASEVIVTTRTVQLRGFGSFDRNPLTDGEVLATPTLIDADCDGVAESPLAANSDIFLGVRDEAAAPFCLVDFGASLCLTPARIYEPDGVRQK